MAQRAILVGVQDYSFSPLTAPAKDVRDVHDALVSNQIFARDDITVLIDDGLTANGPATRDAILETLEPLYNNQPCDRLLFYFSGHGASWRVSSGASVLKPVLLCHGVQNFGRDGGRMIDVEELLERFHMRGPAEQIWIIDACRNLPDGLGRPVVSPTLWEDLPPISVRRRALLYAVAPLAQAAAITGGNSVFTREVLEGLEGRGRAAVYDPGKGSWVVTHRSICDYARARLEPGMAEWEREFKLPRVEFESDPPPSPLRALDGDNAPRPRGISLLVTPAAASAAISARLEREGIVAAEWPPHLQSIQVPPAAFRFEVKLSGKDWVSVDPANAVIDTREVDQIKVTVSGRPRPPLFGSLAEKNLVSEAVLPAISGLVETNRSASATSASWIEIESDDQSVTFSARMHGTSSPAIALRPIYRNGLRWPELEPGLWNIVAELAGEQLGSTDIDLPPKVQVTLRLLASMPTALRSERWSPAASTATSVESPALRLSETMGWIQGAVLPSLLPLVALKAFDESVLENLRTPWLRSRTVKRDQTPISVALALDGDWKGVANPRLFESSLSVGGERSTKRYFAGGGDLGVLAIRTGPSRSPDNSSETPDRNVAILSVPGWGRLEFAVPLVPNRVASIGIVLRAAGRFEMSIASLSPGYDPESRHGRSATSRAIAISARLLSDGSSVGVNAISEAADGKWVDPVLGALSWYAIENRESEFWQGSRATIARNMYGAFPSLADSSVFLYWLMLNPHEAVPSPGRLHAFRYELEQMLLWRRRGPFIEDELRQIHKLFAPELPYDAREPARIFWRPSRFSTVFSDQPILAASVDRLADAAQRIGNMDHWALRRRSLIPPGLVWNAAYFHEANDRSQ